MAAGLADRRYPEEVQERQAALERSGRCRRVGDVLTYDHGPLIEEYAGWPLTEAEPDIFAVFVPQSIAKEVATGRPFLRRLW